MHIPSKTFSYFRNKVIFGLCAVCLLPGFSFSGESKSTPKVALLEPGYQNQAGVSTDTKGPVDEAGRQTGKTAVHSAPSSDIFHSRGQSLDNTFYEIEAPSNVTESVTQASGHSDNNKTTENKAETQVKSTTATSTWTVWAASAAGLVGLGAIGYFVLAPEDNKKPVQNIRVLSDKGN